MLFQNFICVYLLYTKVNVLGGFLLRISTAHLGHQEALVLSVRWHEAT
jgi:hypothetical protein